MKFKGIKIFSWLLMLITLAVTSCRDDTFSNYWDNSDTYTVTLNVGLEDMVATRGERDPQIGNGSKIDMLVYAVYYYNTSDSNNPKWEAVQEYEKKNDDSDKWGIQKGYGQTVVDVSGTLDQGQKYPITLTLKKGEDYRVVFWAQNHETEAFVIDDLKKVQMKYKISHENEVTTPAQTDEGEEDESDSKTYEEEIVSYNNDEARDAFCRSFSLNSDQANRNITIYLRRPLAQINVGTRGFDFESITRNADDNEKFLYSKIRINRAARYLDVVEDKVYTTTIDDPSGSSTEAFYTIDYEYAPIPAYWRWNKEEDGDVVPAYPSYTIFDLENESGAYDTFFDLHSKFGVNEEATDEEKEAKYRQIYGKEEFLKVHLYTDSQLEGTGFTRPENGYVTYSSMGNSLNTSADEDLDRSETFKYLSMCYVLTNSSDDYQDVLTNVKVWLTNKEGLTNKDGGKEIEVVNLNQVPVQRNHRTNIVGSLLTAKATMQIIVDDDFAGRKIDGETEVRSGEITEGFYYDADKDEFQISSVNGLLFFQQLVNGDLTVRQAYDHFGGAIDVNYPYYTIDGKGPYRLNYKSHNRSDYELQDKADLIYYGSKYDKLVENKNSYAYESAGKKWKITVSENANWPVNNNFPFYGATVKLMADIDLSGIEWIPIGFDCACWDSSLGEWDKDHTSYEAYNSNSKTLSYISLATKYNASQGDIELDNRRVFCGTFDGNGHTIYNLNTVKFGAKVCDEALQDYTKRWSQNTSSRLGGPYDNVQWFAYGFFGVVGPGAVIKDLRLQNVNVQGYNSVGALVGQVSSIGFPVKIENCIVDGGKIDAVPLYRGDFNYSSISVSGRTMARGCYIGGLIGQFVAKDDYDSSGKLGPLGEAGVTGCEVRNIVLQGFRRVGGIIGGIADQGSTAMGNKDIQLDINVEKNSVVNSVMLLNQYRAFNYYWDYMGNSGNWMNGFGWLAGTSYAPMRDNIVGGYLTKEVIEAYQETDGNEYNAFSSDFGYFLKNTNETRNSYFNAINNSKGNQASNIQYCELAIQTNVKTNDTDDNRTATARVSHLNSVPLKYIPPFTSLFTDNVYLDDNFYGESSLKTRVKFYNDAHIWYNGTDESKNNYKYSIPINFPVGYEIEYKDGAESTGLYVESVTLDGSGAPGGRSVITPTGVNGEKSSVMYITARNRYQFKTDNKPSVSTRNMVKVTSSSDPIGSMFRQNTNVSHVVLRGSPYAWAGIIMAPNWNMKQVNLDHVTIYDVYKTITTLQDDEEEAALKAESDNRNKYQNYTFWPESDTNYTSWLKNNSNATDAVKKEYRDINLVATNCNFRGYTCPGFGWSGISYISTTFEAGAETTYSNSAKSEGYTVKDMRKFKTCEVEAPTTFQSCHFKAPFFIDLSKATGEVNFRNCQASSAYNDILIDPAGVEQNNSGKKVAYIQIDKDTERGKTVVTYYQSDGTRIYRTYE